VQFQTQGVIKSSKEAVDLQPTLEQSVKHCYSYEACLGRKESGHIQSYQDCTIQCIKHRGHGQVTLFNPNRLNVNFRRGISRNLRAISFTTSCSFKYAYRLPNSCLRISDSQSEIRRRWMKTVFQTPSSNSCIKSTRSMRYKQKPNCASLLENAF